MDGKYARYFGTYGFITKLKIKGDELHVYTKETAKGEPNKYPLREKITEYSERLENQYRLITDEENITIVKNDLINSSRKKLNKTLLILSIIVFLGTFFSSLALSTLLPLCIGVAVEISLMIGHATTLNKIIKNFDEEMDMVKTYLYSRSDMEKMSKKDPNVISNLKPSTLNRININNELYRDNMIPDIFDITLLDDLMSKATSKKELNKLLKSYLICVALRQPQVFVDPNEECEESVEKTNAKTRARYLGTKNK